MAELADQTLPKLQVRVPAVVRPYGCGLLAGEISVEQGAALLPRALHQRGPRFEIIRFRAAGEDRRFDEERPL